VKARRAKQARSLNVKSRAPGRRAQCPREHVTKHYRGDETGLTSSGGRHGHKSRQIETTRGRSMRDRHGICDFTSSSVAA
jgi:hypothetical protein